MAFKSSSSRFLASAGPARYFLTRIDRPSQYLDSLGETPSMRSEECLVVGQILKLFNVCFQQARASARQRRTNAHHSSGYSTHCLGETPHGGATYCRDASWIHIPISPYAYHVPGMRGCSSCKLSLTFALEECHVPP